RYQPAATSENRARNRRVEIIHVRDQETPTRRRRGALGSGSAMLKLVKARIVLEILGIILLSVFIWFAGPYFAFADFRPFNPEWTRLTAAALLGLIWAGIKIGKVVKAASASSKLANAVASQPDPAPSSDEAQLRERFEEAIAALKASRGRDRSLYSDPWYVIIGAPGSGKST